MAISLDAILRNMLVRTPSNEQVNTSAPVGAGLTGLSTGGNGAPSTGGFNTQYNAPGFDVSVPNLPNFDSVDDMGFDSQYSGLTDQLHRALADAASQYQNANQNDEQEYQRVLRDSEQENKQMMVDFTDRMANQGMLRSGINVKGQSDIANQYQNRLGQYQQQRTQAKTARDTSYSNIQRGVQDSLGTLQQERTRRQQLAEEERAKKEAEALRNQQPQQTNLGTLYPGQPGGEKNSPNLLNGSNPYVPVSPGYSTPESPKLVIAPGAIKRALMPGKKKI